MKEKLLKHHPAVHISLLIAIFVAFGMTLFVGYKFYILSGDLALAERTTASTTAMVENLTNALSASERNRLQLQSELQFEQTRNNDFQAQITGLSSTIGVLDKLSKTDKELLQKYSNVYFLSENYVPSSLMNIDTAFLDRKDMPEQIHTKADPFLNSLIQSANGSGAPLLVLSGYRSFGKQSGLKATYKLIYGSGTANSFSADQGYSEHQLGTAVDFTTQSIGATLSGFDKTVQYNWLLENAWHYGFIISYPKGNKYFTFEPWHWRFVGVALATYLHNNNKYFYDLDQRTIDQYLVNIFD